VERRDVASSVRTAAATGPAETSKAGAAPDSWIEQVVACAGLFSLGLWRPVGSGIASAVTVGDIIAILLIPVWFGQLRRYAGARALLVLAVAAAWSGFLLSEWSKADHRVSQGLSADSLMLLLGTVAGAGFVLWTRRVLPVSQIGIWYGSGLIAGLLLKHLIALSTAGWKNGLAVAAGILGLALANRVRHRRIAEAVVLVLLAGLSIAFDSRSYFATFLLTLMVVIWQMRPQRLSRRAALQWTVALLAGLAVGIYYLGTTLLLNGYLGRSAQARSIEQIRTAGSLLLGGRPELGATLALFRNDPTGFGTGVIANMHDIMVAKTGLAALHYDPNNGYVDKYMFGGQIELHSMLGDVWAAFGLVGLLFLAFVTYLVIRGLVRSIATRIGSALLVFLCWWTLWNLMFSPLFSAAPSLLLVLGLVMPLRDGPGAADAPPVPVPVDAGAAR
jgi:hypothetical protein